MSLQDDVKNVVDALVNSGERLPLELLHDLVNAVHGAFARAGETPPAAPTAATTSETPPPAATDQPAGTPPAEPPAPDAPAV